ncbi:helix-turn-helix domain-containing protein [Marinobacter sp. JSM 1782161]|uniref:helix-turn-helix domain-containing protein n=1 Tax=Marinobacter sp. JSM 1782161 TaxID=2685906 RepID=UPI0014021837|nr:helix-turn-helix domain-containing protein [Marinobacter sp. JSM 1782161]
MQSLAELTDILQARRKQLGLSQKDMRMRIGMSQQQYQKIESGSDVRLSTLLRILEGMGLELAIRPPGQESASRSVDRASTDARADIEPEASVWSVELGDLKDSE